MLHLPNACPLTYFFLSFFFFWRGGSLQQNFLCMVTGVKFLPPCLLTTEPALCFHKHLRAASTSLVAPPVVFAAGSERKQSLAGTAGCLGNTLCHSSGLEQELAYPCQSAGRIWAMPCVNRLSDFHSDGSGISPTPPFSGKATPASLFLKAPRALLSSPISCLNYALLCAVVFFSTLPPPLLPPLLLVLIPHPPPFSLSVSHSLFVKRWGPRFWSLRSVVGTVLGFPPPPLPPTTQLPFSLPSSLHLKGNTVFSMHKRLGAVNRMNPPGPMENILSYSFSEREEEGKRKVDGWVREAAGRDYSAVS